MEKPYRFEKTIYSEVYLHIIEELKKGRKEAGLTQEEAARVLGCRQTFLSKIENSERRLDLVEFLLIAKTYQIDPVKVLNEVNNLIAERVDQS